jgi:hypothetical protein
LTPSGILHIVAFVTLCEAYMGIEPHFDLWNYFFHARLRLGSDEEAGVWGSLDIFIWSRSRVDSYFCFPMSDPLVGWWNVWFFLRNDTNVLLLVFTGYCPTLNLNGGMVWLSNMSVGYNPCAISFDSCYKVS